MHSKETMILYQDLWKNIQINATFYTHKMKNILQGETLRFTGIKGHKIYSYWTIDWRKDCMQKVGFP